MSADLDIALEKFDNLAEIHGKALAVGDSDTANSVIDECLNALREIASYGRLGSSELEKRLAFAAPGVRLWAATQLLGEVPTAEQALEALSSLPGTFVAITAQATLDEWRNGRLVKFWLAE